MNSLIIAALLGFCAQSEPTITYTCPGKNAKAVFEDLSKQAGQTLLIGQSLAEEPIILRLDKAPLSKTMDRLAFALNGEWKAEREGKRLVAKGLPADATPYHSRLRTIIAVQKTAKEELAKAKPFDEKVAADYAKELENHFRLGNSHPKRDELLYEIAYRFSENSPSAGFGLKLLSLLDPKQLAEPVRGERIVWSTHPTARQRQLPPSVRKLSLQYLQERSYWNAELLTRPTLLDNINESYYLGIYVNPEGLDSNTASVRATSPFYKINITTFSIDSIENSLQVVFLDQSGNIVHQFSYAKDEMLPAISKPSNSQEPLLKPVDKQIVLDELASEYFRKVREYYREEESDERGRRPITFSQQLLNVLSHPEVTDPLSIAAGPILIQYAAAKNEQLVAILTDWVAFVIPTSQEGIVNQSRFLNHFRPQQRNHLVDYSSGWIAIGVNPIAKAEGTLISDRTPRDSMGIFFRQVLKDRRLTIEAAASFLSAIGTDIEIDSLSLGTDQLDMLGYSTGMLSYQESRTALRFLATLSPLQIIGFRNGQSLSFGSLSEKQKALLRYELYTRTHPRVAFGGSNPMNENEASDETELETTERYIPDISPNARITVSERPVTFVYATGIDSDGEATFVYNEVLEFGEALSLAMQDGATFDKFYSEVMRTVTIRLALDKMSYLQFEVSEEQRKTPIVDSLDKLPPEIAQQIRKDMAKFKPPSNFLWKQAS